MRTYKWAFATVLSVVFYLQSEAQVSVNVNIGAPPVWAPVAPVGVGFYFLPEIETYYDVQQSNFIYLNRGRWISSRQLPPHYRNYDLYHGRTVFLSDYHGHHPYYHYKQHKARYYAAHYVPRRSYHARPASHRYVVRERYHGRQNWQGRGHGNGNGHRVEHHNSNGHRHGRH